MWLDSFCLGSTFKHATGLILWQFDFQSCDWTNFVSKFLIQLSDSAVRQSGPFQWESKREGGSGRNFFQQSWGAWAMVVFMVMSQSMISSEKCHNTQWFTQYTIHSDSHNTQYTIHSDSEHIENSIVLRAQEHVSELASKWVSGTS